MEGNKRANTIPMRKLLLIYVCCCMVFCMIFLWPGSVLPQNQGWLARSQINKDGSYQIVRIIQYKDWWKVSVSLTGGCALLLFIGIAWAASGDKLPSRGDKTFLTPLFPLTPLLGIACNCLMAVHIGPDSLVRCLLWNMIGSAVYIGYGMKHSLLNNANPDQSTQAPVSEQSALLANHSPKPQ